MSFSLLVVRVQDVKDYFERPREDFIAPSDRALFASLTTKELPSNLEVVMPVTRPKKVYRSVLLGPSAR